MTKVRFKKQLSTKKKKIKRIILNSGYQIVEMGGGRKVRGEIENPLGELIRQTPTQIHEQSTQVLADAKDKNSASWQQPHTQ